MNKLEANRVQEIAENIKSQHIRGDATDLIEHLKVSDGSAIYDDHEEDERFDRKVEYEAACLEKGWEARQVGDKYAIIQKHDGKYRDLYCPKEDSDEYFFQSLLDYFSEKQLEDIDSVLALVNEAQFLDSSDLQEAWLFISCALGYRPRKREFESYWDVSPWLTKHLEAQGEVVYPVYHMNIWCCVGVDTTVYRDEVILKIARASEEAH